MFNYKSLIVSFTLVVTGCNGSSDALTIEQQLVKEQALTNGMCSKSELLDRWLLQQTWFHTKQFQNVSIVFGQYSFSYYKTSGDVQDETEGAFCIDGENLNIQYYKTTFLPNDIDFNTDAIVTIKFGRNTNLLATDIFTITTLTDKLLTFKIHSTNETHTFYRKN